ncbi:hypothetical protein GQ53DRAFT_764100 [Thozetella sp. PMI_491]|nr:hypothetical protein GQ53DRAFT_764100 [Thozetella sp. PMI_491]
MHTLAPVLHTRALVLYTLAPALSTLHQHQHASPLQTTPYNHRTASILQFTRPRRVGTAARHSAQAPNEKGDDYVSAVPPNPSQSQIPSDDRSATSDLGDSFFNDTYAAPTPRHGDISQGPAASPGKELETSITMDHVKGRIQERIGTFKSPSTGSISEGHGATEH